jgi:hypothetical protein
MTSNRLLCSRAEQGIHTLRGYNSIVRNREDWIEGVSIYPAEIERAASTRRALVTYGYFIHREW